MSFPTATKSMPTTPSWTCEVCDLHFYSAGALHAHKNGVNHQQKRKELGLEWHQDNQKPTATTTTTASHIPRADAREKCVGMWCQNLAAQGCANSSCRKCCRLGNLHCQRHSSYPTVLPKFPCNFGLCPRMFDTAAARDAHMKSCQRRFDCLVCHKMLATAEERDIHIATDLDHLREVHGTQGVVLDEEVLAQLAISNLSKLGAADFGALNDTARMLQVEHDHAIVAVALYNFEAFYGIEHGTATYKQVGQTSAGIEGWAGSGVTDEPRTSNQDQGGNDKKPALVPASTTSNKGATKGDQEEAQMLKLAMMESALESHGVRTPNRAVFEQETSIQGYYHGDGEEDDESSSTSSSDEASYCYDDDEYEYDEADEYHSDSESEADNTDDKDSSPADEEDGGIVSDEEEDTHDSESDDGSTRNDSSTGDSWSRVSGGGTADGSWSHVSTSASDEASGWSLAEDDQESFDELLLDG